MWGLDKRVSVIEADVPLIKNTLMTHLQACEKRGARLEKLAWWALGIGVSILGFLLKTQLHITI